MIDSLLEIVAPHHCCGCGKVGTLLCDNCKYDIISEPYIGCVVCQRPTNGEGICSRCDVPYSKAWAVGLRNDTLATLIDQYKFERAKSAQYTLASLLDERIPQVPKNTIVVPVPTISRHIRVRGYDHTKLIAAAFARRRTLSCQQVLQHRTTTVQLGSTKAQRDKQASQAFAVRRPLASVPHLLIDDVLTTGATVRYAAKALMDAGASEVWIAIIARQPMD